MEYVRLKRAGIYAKDVLEALIKNTKSGSILNPQGYYDLIFKSGAPLEEVIGKVTVNGTPVKAVDATKNILTQQVNYTFSQETSEGFTVQIGEYKPPVQIPNLTQTPNVTNTVTEKYKVFVENVDTGKTFTSEKEVNEYVAKAKANGLQVRIDKEVIPNTSKDTLVNMLEKKSELNISIARSPSTSNVTVHYSWKAPETVEDKALYQNLVDNVGKTKADISYMESIRLKRAGELSKEVVDQIKENIKLGKKIDPKWLYDLATKTGAPLNEVIGKVSVDGKLTSLSDAINFTRTHEVIYQFIQETSDGLMIELGEYQFPVQIVNFTLPPQQPINIEPQVNKNLEGLIDKTAKMPVPKKFYIIIEGEDLYKKTFGSPTDALKFVIDNKLNQFPGVFVKIVPEEEIPAAKIEYAEFKRKRVEEMQKQKPAVAQQKPAEKPATIEKIIEAYNPNPTFFACKRVSIVKKGLFSAAQPEFSDKTNRFKLSDGVGYIGYERVAGGGNLSTEISYNGNVVMVGGGNICNILFSGSDTMDLNTLVNKGGFGEFEVKIKQNGDLKESFKIYVEK
jgi:hypothetical protein